VKVSDFRTQIHVIVPATRASHTCVRAFDGLDFDFAGIVLIVWNAVVEGHFFNKFRL
jgi:hypothetical protein